MSFFMMSLWGKEKAWKKFAAKDIVKCLKGTLYVSSSFLSFIFVNYFETDVPVKKKNCIDPLKGLKD